MNVSLSSDSYKPSQSLGPGAYGLPSSIRQADSVPMVETTNRFISLSSRPRPVSTAGAGAAAVSSVPTSGYNTPRKKSSIGGKGRQVRGQEITFQPEYQEYANFKLTFCSGVLHIIDSSVSKQKNTREGRQLHSVTRTVNISSD